ncbi:MAG: DNA mismatch repair protein Msh2 [Amphiamblys sp. WSBS2006]|nr:MAG: DNA mismatch repair protein Msh2 [Amphiamblys sp. WSBS2006]
MPVDNLLTSAWANTAVESILSRRIDVLRGCGHQSASLSTRCEESVWIVNITPVSSPGMSSRKTLPSLIDETPHSTICFIDTKTEYTLYGRSASFIAENTIGAKEHPPAQVKTGVPTLYKRTTIPKGMFGAVVSDVLNVFCLNAEIWEHEDNTYVLKNSASPGNLAQMDEEGIDIDTAATIGALWLERTSGELFQATLFLADTVQKKLTHTRFTDTVYFPTLECVMLQCATRECLVSSENIAAVFKPRSKEEKEFFRVFQTGAVSLKKKDTPGECTPLDDILGHSPAPLPPASAQAFALLSSAVCFPEGSLYTLKEHNPNLFMKIDSTALNALNILPKRKGDRNCIFGLLNNCKTRQGERLLSHCVRQPLLNIDELNTRYDLVTAFVSNVSLKATVRESILSKMPDVGRLLKRVQSGRGSLKSIVSMYDAAKLMLALEDILAAYGDETVNTVFTALLGEQKENTSRFCSLIESHVDFTHEANHEYFMKSLGSPEENEIERRKKTTETEIRRVFQETADELGLSPDRVLKLEHSPAHGHYIRMPRKHSAALDKEKHGVVTMLKNGIYFSTPRLSALSSEHAQLLLQKKRKAKEHERAFLDQVVRYASCLEVLSDVSANIDVIASLAVFCSSSPEPFSRPLLSRHGTTKILKARHPLVERQAGSFVANDIVLTPEKRFQIVTGPNTGGKSTYIRQAGVCVFLAQIGCLVPCAEAEISVADAVFARIGASDNQFKGLSTFMVEMSELAGMLRNATQHTLLIIDELGRGTSISDGYGLACAISKHIVTDIKCPCLFATHFHELTLLEKQHSAVCNLSVSVHIGEDGLVPTYNIKKGPCDRSFGVHVAEVAGFPAGLVEAAKMKRFELETPSFVFDKETEDKIKTLHAALARGPVDSNTHPQEFSALKKKVFAEIEYA